MRKGLEVVEPEAPAHRAVERDGHPLALGLLVDRPVTFVAEILAVDGDRRQQHGAEIGPFGGAAGDFLLRRLDVAVGDQPDAPEPAVLPGVMLLQPVVVGDAGGGLEFLALHQPVGEPRGGVEDAAFEPDLVEDLRPDVGIGRPVPAALVAFLHDRAARPAVEAGEDGHALETAVAGPPALVVLRELAVGLEDVAVAVEDGNVVFHRLKLRSGSSAPRVKRIARGLKPRVPRWREARPGSRVIEGWTLHRPCPIC